MKWTEALIASGISHQLFKRSVLIVPNCGWTGHECDLLVIDKSMRIIDVEIKISRSDLKQDAKKDKWWTGRPWSRRAGPIQARQWPDKVWKHYYVMPAEIWDTKLLAGLPLASGVATMRQDSRYNSGLAVTIIRPAKPCKEAKPVCPADCIDIARLASLRMWAALSKG